MIFWLVGLVFNVVTFPGMLVNGVIQDRYDERYGVPAERLAIDDDVDLEGEEMDEAALADVARVLDDGESAGADETAEWVFDYDGVERYPDLFKVVLFPLGVTTVVGAAIFTVTALLLTSGVLTTDGLLWLLPFWLGFATLAHAFPNRDPTNALWRRTRETDSLLAVLGYPIVGLSKLFDLLEFLWIDALYAFGVWVLVAYAVGFYPT